MNPFDALEEHYPEIIAAMPTRFNSHEFILKLAHRYQHLYVKALAQYADRDVSPFQAAHGQLARRLAKFPHLVRYVGVEPSQHIFGGTTEVALWRRVKEAN
jgi:hypothetical protein